MEIKEKAEAAKIALSSDESASIELFGTLKDEKNALIDIDVTINRSEFDELLQPIVKRIAKVTTQILHEIRFEPELIDTVLMVGGTSLIPAIQQELKNIFEPEKVMLHPRPMHAIAEGAAWMAARMNNQENNQESLEQSTLERSAFSMMHSTAHDYYLQLANGQRHLLIARNSPLPATVEEKFSFSQADQHLARLRVFNEIDGLLETVGELWVHQNMDKSKEKNRTPEFMLQFSVDENNIITMKAWSLENEKEQVETQIARGGLATKLYNDLEQTLSSVIAHCKEKTTENDALRLSQTIVSSILAASDPITGETRIEQKRKVQNQIETLKYCQQKDIAPLAMYEFLEIARERSKNVISSEEQLRLNNIIMEFKTSLESFEDGTNIESVTKQLSALYEDLPILADLSRAENAAFAVEQADSGLAKRIRNQASVLANLHKQQKHEDAIEEARDTLYDIIYGNISWNNSPTRRFDRDVCL